MAMATSARVVDAAVRPLLPLASHGFSGRGAAISFKKALLFPHLELGSGSAAWRNLAVSAMADNEWEGNTEDPCTEAIGATATLEKPADVLGLKRALIDSLAGSELGLKGTSETRAGIIELINQLEAKNPTPAPTEALQLLDGKWILAYTSFPELFPLFAAGLPLVKVGEISQTIDAQGFTAQNSIIFTGPIGYTSFSTSASFEVKSPKRVQIKFEEGIIGTPQLMDAIDIPESFELMGQKIDLTPIKGLLKPLQDAASSVAKTLNGRPPLKFPIQTDKNQSWLLTTYLDNELRISRGDGGNVFVLIREGSELLYSL